MNCLQNPSLLSGGFSLSGMGKVSQVYSFCKWGALILALVATFSGILIKIIKILLIRFRTFKSFASSEPFFEQLDDDLDFSDDETCSLESSEDEEFDFTENSEDRQPVDEDFSVAGSSYYRDEQWQNRDLGLRRRRSGGDRLSWSDFGTEVNDSNEVLLGAYDTRIGHQIPAIYAEWRPSQRNTVGINSGGVEKVYVRDEVTGTLTVGDMRNVKTPLENITESDGDTWWDADAVIVSDEFVDDSR
ncbi:hypothetical protein F0562_034051 [Nyssa sinensis]|uniref:Uncharacterized protein n=1 Tax=Nyssa sinensis TaxID=561372 RepID=A0A5J5AF01_9ASTE|nr:hypothetical protein F0562_034051 [Nyssa sinensis]